MLRHMLRATALVALFFIAPSLAASQDRRQNTPGQFDFYLLSLSWSPSFCESAGERGNNGRGVRQQCGERPYSFVVHGLWPQYEKGFPEYCQVPAPRLNHNIVSSMLDIMPAPGLIFHEWDAHGTCSGLSPRAYFDLVRKARAVVKIPEDYLDLKEPLTVTPNEVEEAFLKANPSLKREGMSVDCDNKRLREVRLCLNRYLEFRECAETRRRGCRRDRIVMPPVRGGRERID